MQLPVLRRLVVSARARGMPEIKSHGKLFLIKFSGAVAYQGCPMNPYRAAKLSVVWEIIRPKSWRRTIHLVAVNKNPASMAWGKFFFVGRHDCSASGTQTKN